MSHKEKFSFCDSWLTLELHLYGSVTERNFFCSVTLLVYRNFLYEPFLKISFVFLILLHRHVVFLHQSDLDQIQIELSPSPDWEAAGTPTMGTGADMEFVTGTTDMPVSNYIGLGKIFCEA